MMAKEKRKQYMARLEEICREQADQGGGVWMSWTQLTAHGSAATMTIPVR